MAVCKSEYCNQSTHVWQTNSSQVLGFQKAVREFTPVEVICSYALNVLIFFFFFFKYGNISSFFVGVVGFLMTVPVELTGVNLRLNLI